MKKDIFNSAFWKSRLDGATELRESVFQTSQQNWDAVWQDHRRIIGENLPAFFDKPVLDAGCGYGRLSELFLSDAYIGVDQSPDLITKALECFPGKYFAVADLRELPYRDSYFSWAICISIQIMVIENAGYLEWEKIQNELLRVTTDGILCLEYGEGDTNTTSSTYSIVRKNK